MPTSIASTRRFLPVRELDGGRSATLDDDGKILEGERVASRTVEFKFDSEDT